MKLNSIKIENFLSIKDAEIDFEDFSELVRVVGINQDTKPPSSNGAGKSSIIEAIAFALFGKTIRKTTEKSLKNSHTKGICKVTLRVNDTTVIERVKKPPMLRLIIDGENQTQENIQVTQKYLENFLNINQSVFLASIVFGQGIATNFLTASAEEKRNIIQNFLNVSDIFKQRGRIKSIKSHYNNDKKVASTLLDDASRKLEVLKTKRTSLRKILKEAANILSSEKAKFIKRHTMSEIQEMERDYRELEVRFSIVLQAKSDKESTSHRARERIRRNDNAKCEHCDKISLRAWEQNKEDIVLVERCKDEILQYKEEAKKLERDLANKTVPIDVQDFELIEQVKSVDTEVKLITKSIKDQKRRMIFT